MDSIIAQINAQRSAVAAANLEILMREQKNRHFLCSRIVRI